MRRRPDNDLADIDNGRLLYRECDGTGNCIRRYPHLFHRGLRLGFQLRARHGIREAGAGHARRDHRYPQRSARFLSQTFRDRSHRELGARIDRHAWDDAVRCRGRDVDEMTCPLLAKGGQGGRDAIEHALDVDVDHRVPVVDARRHIQFAGILEGSFWLWTEDGEPPLYLNTGDFYLLTHGQPYCTGSDPTLVPIDGREVLASCMDADGIVRYGQHGDKVSAAGGRFVFDADAEDLLLKLLPPLVHVPAGSEGAPSLRALLELLRLETEAVRPGGAVVATNLANMVLMQSLRLRMASWAHLPGWLGALADPKIGAALHLLHADIAHRWTVDELASSVAMSRTTFAERFKAMTGVPPLRYLIEWRVAVASAALKSNHRSISEVAEIVGYGSAAAFSSVFFKVTGRRPGQYRVESAVVERDP